MENQEFRRESDLVLPPKMFAFVLDKTKGNVTTYCGPQKTSLSQTDQPVIYNASSSTFKNVGLDQALQTDIAAKQGEYIILTNTANNGSHPVAGKAEQMNNDLIDVGKTENISGPASFPLWPGQIAEVVQGHNLRTNQYLLVRVYDDEAAKNNWDSAVIKEAGDTPHKEEKVTAEVDKFDKKNLAIGKLFIIRGTDVSFYIPPTGVEVLKENGSYVRDACTLERLEYCVLLEENGDKRYVRGPAVVFPTPTETFLKNKNKDRKFKAYELNENSGLYVKVIAEYTEGETVYTPGTELFITGTDTPIYFPRMEHAIIKYEDKEKHHAVAIPKGEARYVLNRKTGDVRLERGPQMFLPNPINDVVVKRVLSEDICNLYYPGNNVALTYNRGLNAVKKEVTREGNFLSEDTDDLISAQVERSLVGDSMTRGTRYTPPRTITLDTKYDGAVTVSPWTGYAIQIVNKNGDRRVVEGPNTVMLEYDEQLEKLALSTGKPKSNDVTKETVYLRTLSNPVSDRLRIRTSDLIEVEVQLKYLVRFVGNKDKWFSVENYVQYLCDHMRSIIGNHTRNIDVTTFYENAADIIRDLILGATVKDKDGKSTRRNRLFPENNMEIYEVEIINVDILDEEIDEVLSVSKRKILEDQISLENSAMELKVIKQNAEITREKEKEVSATVMLKEELKQKYEEQYNNNLTLLERLKIERNDIITKAEQEKAKIQKEINDIKLLSEEANKELQERFANLADMRKMTMITRETESAVAKSQAIQPKLVEALTATAQTGLMKEMAEHLAPLSIVEGKSLAGSLTTLLDGTPLEKILDNVQKMGVVSTKKEAS